MVAEAELSRLTGEPCLQRRHPHHQHGTSWARVYTSTYPHKSKGRRNTVDLDHWERLDDVFIARKAGAIGQQGYTSKDAYNACM